MRLFASVIAIMLAAAGLVAGTASGGRQAVDPKAGRVTVSFHASYARFAFDMVGEKFFAMRPFGLERGSSVELVPRGIAEIKMRAFATAKPRLGPVLARVSNITWTRFHTPSESEELDVRATISKSTWKRCPVGTPIRIVMEAEQHRNVARTRSPVCGSNARAKAHFLLAGDLPPKWFQLTVNNGAPARHYWLGPGKDVPPIRPSAGLTLTIKAETDERLPPGWSVYILRTGDPLSPGNGDYYRPCSIPADYYECTSARPGLAHGTAELVSVVMTDPWGGWQEQGARIEWD